MKMIRSAMLVTSALTGALILTAVPAGAAEAAAVEADQGQAASTSDAVGALPTGVIRPRSIGLSLTVGL